ncbi:MAG: flagellin [Dehalococcoidia bacterium]|nr:flagellin [Dehalococcoidia bacterium]MDW8120115.1 hypothetical protein [Chloroflexota bacterium]
MDKAISTVLLIIAGVIATLVVMRSVYPAVVRGGNAIINVAQQMNERIETHISIVFATGELDSGGTWQDTDGDGLFDVTLWVKNVGSSRILGITDVDVFYGRPGSFLRVPYVGDAGGAFPSWSYTLENDTEWKSMATLKISIHFAEPQPSGTYLVKVITPTGAHAEQWFSY